MCIGPDVHHKYLRTAGLQAMNRTQYANTQTANHGGTTCGDFRINIYLSLSTDCLRTVYKICLCMDLVQTIILTVLLIMRGS